MLVRRTVAVVRRIILVEVRSRVLVVHTVFLGGQQNRTFELLSNDS